MKDLSTYTKLHIGCGKQHFNDFVNMDISDYCNPDIQHDIRKGLPQIPNNALEEVVANGILEMILPNEEFLLVLNEIWRVLKPEGKLKGQVPSIDPRVLMLDPFDRRWFKEETFNYWNVFEHAYNEFGTQYGFKPWIVDYAKTNENGIIIFEMRPSK